MKSALLVFALSAGLFFSGTVKAQIQPEPTQVVQVVAPVAQTETVAVAEPAAPPKWAEDLIVNAQKLPVVGPILTKALMYAGIVGSIMTALIACLLTILSALSGIANMAGLASFAQKLQVFKNGKIMFWLTSISLFNAKQNAKVNVVAVEETKAAA